VLTTLHVASLLLADGAHAQANACDQLKEVLAARINSGIGTYSLEAVPAGTPVPPGSKVIGTCEGGARKILFRRGGAAPPSSDVASAAGPASAPQALAAPTEPKRRSPDVQRDRALPLVPASAPASASSASPRPVSRSVGAASAAATPVAEREKSPNAMDSASSAAPSVDPVLNPPAPSGLDETSVSKIPLRQRAAEFIGRYWQGFLAVALVLLAAVLWAWFSHRSAYDEAGLPRGPKLN
jgi:hypothetical protein